jgi:lysozyme
MALPLNEKRARAATRWLVEHFGDSMRQAVEETPFSVELLCGIACQETAFLWLPFVQGGATAATVLARSIGDASGDAPDTTRSAFPRDSDAFRAKYGDEFTDLLVAEANASRALRGMGPKTWVYKGYGIFQYDLQHVRTDESFFRERQWYELEACLDRVIRELTVKFQRTGELWSAVKAYNGSGRRAEEYRDNVRVFTQWARDEIGRILALPSPPAAPPARAARRARATLGPARRSPRRAAALAAARPRITREELQRRIEPFRVDRSVHRVMVVGIRGYYLDALGAPGVNDRGIYDDALIIDAPESFATFNGNTDPSRYRAGHGVASGKGIATLNAGLWYAYRFGLHNDRYLALCQRLAQVTVTRDGNPPYPDTGMFGINIHKGGYNTTSSLGCQTVHPDQWRAFIELAVDQAKRWYGDRWNRVVIPYLLLE